MNSPLEEQNLEESPHTTVKSTRKRIITWGVVAALILTGGSALTAVSIANAETQKVAAYREAEKTYNTSTVNLNKAQADTPAAAAQLTAAAATATQHVAELQKFFAAESAFSPDARTAINETIPAVTETIPTEEEASKTTTTVSAVSAPLKQEPKIADKEITAEKSTQLEAKTKTLEARISATKKQLEDWKKETAGITQAITGTVPALVAAAQSAHPAAGSLIEVTPAATPESQQAVLDALAVIDATSVVAGTVAAADATVEDARALSAALNAYTDAITARGESHVAGVAAAEAAAAEAAAQQNAPTYQAPDGSQKPNPKHNPQAPSNNPGGGGNPSSPSNPGGGGNPSSPSNPGGGGGQAPWSPGGNYVPGCAGFSDSDFSKTMANRAGEASPGFPYDYSVSGDTVTIYRCI